VVAEITGGRERERERERERLLVEAQKYDAVLAFF
jgi:hypothetical protein